MVLGSFIFAALFLFLFTVLIISTISMFKKEKQTNQEPAVSIIIPCYNERKNIKSCLDAIYSSDYPKEKMEFIVVDDGSTDDTREILEAYKKTQPLLKIIKGNHEGKAESLNKGVKIAKYNIVFTVDADTLIKKDTLRKLVQPFSFKNVGATNGSCVVRNKKCLLGMFQNIEYHYNNLIRKSFSTLFRNGIWFYGAFACYRKDLLEKIGYFKKDTLTEDADIALEIYASGYKTVNVHHAYGLVKAPSTLRSLVKQRMRWWIGVLQALKKNKSLFSRKSSPSILFFFINQYWWSVYAVVSLPLIVYQFNYWLPYNTETFSMTFMYTFRWFSFLGPVHVLYMIPEWGISLYSIFGVLSGIITVVLITSAFFMFRERPSIRTLIGIFFYFPYTIVLNTIIIISLVKIKFLKKRYFIN